MSAIAGVFSRRGAPRRPGEVDQMLAVMASRGPDGTSTWSTDKVTLGYRALHATPESVHEQMPLVDRLTGNVIVADVRLDNRPELIHKLGLDGRDPIKIGDGRLLLDAYRNWGENCVDHLLGDFAFAIWDERRQQLFLARDHFGAKPLTYHSSDGLVAFASDSRAVVGLEDVPGTINRDRVFDFLVQRVEWVDTTATFFEQVHRLSPAHTMTVSPTGQRIRKYWRLNEPTILRLGSDAEYEEATREVLDLVVSCRLRGRDDVGVVLSGGIDSSSIAATVRARGPLRTYSAASKDDTCAETRMTRMTTATLCAEVLTVGKSMVHELEYFSQSQRHRESPFSNGAMLRTVFTAARRDGCRSVVTGVLADEVVAISAAVAARAFIAQRDFLELYRLAASDGNLRSSDGRLALVKSALSGLSDMNAHVAHLRSARRHESWEKWTEKALHDLHLFISPDEKRRLNERLDATPWTPRKGDGPGSLRHRFFEAGYGASALERYDRSAAATSVEARSPFMDVRAVEYFLSLPARKLVGDGWTKSLLRRSMTDRLPDEVVWNRAKPHLGWSFTLEWLDIDPQEFLHDLSASHPLHDYVDVSSVLNGLPSAEEDRVDHCFRYACLGLWLETFTEGSPKSTAKAG